MTEETLLLEISRVIKLYSGTTIVGLTPACVKIAEDFASIRVAEAVKEQRQLCADWYGARCTQGSFTAENHELILNAPSPINTPPLKEVEQKEVRECSVLWCREIIKEGYDWCLEHTISENES